MKRHRAVRAGVVSMMLVALLIPTFTTMALADDSHARHEIHEHDGGWRYLGDHWHEAGYCVNGEIRYEVYEHWINQIDVYQHHYDESGNLVEHEYLLTYDGDEIDHVYLGETC